MCGSTVTQDTNTNSNEENKEQKKSTKTNTEIGVFTGNYKNDGISGEFDGLTYPHSREMLKVKHFIFLSTYICQLPNIKQIYFDLYSQYYSLNF